MLAPRLGVRGLRRDLSARPAVRHQRTPEFLGRGLGRHHQPRQPPGRPGFDGLAADGLVADAGRRPAPVFRSRGAILNDHEFQIVTEL